MKLRLRSFETKESFKIEVPNPCNLQHLKELLSLKFTSPHPSTIHLSLNRKDELTDSSPEESIQAIGITSGDLIHFTTNPSGFSTNPQIVQSVGPPIPKLEESQNIRTLKLSSMEQDETPITRTRAMVDLSSGKVKEVGFTDPYLEEGSESMEIDNDGRSVCDAGKSFSVPGFLRKVFTEESGNDGGLNHKLLVIAVHAVLLESGFVDFDPSSNSLKTNIFDFYENWHSSAFFYTLPDIINSGNVENGVINSVKIRFQNIGRYCTVYGSLVNGAGTHWVLLDEDRLVPFLNVVWANCGQMVDTIEENNRASSVSPERKVFGFWRTVKDRLVLPLLIDLCEKAGLVLPPCFMCLPMELKLKILEHLPVVDIAAMSSVCSELRYLGSSEDLWKQKYFEEFGSEAGSGGRRTFKEKFANAWVSRKMRKASLSIIRSRRNAPLGSSFIPGIIGGNYDVVPNAGRFGRYNQLRHHGGGVRCLRNTATRCDLGLGGCGS